MNNIKSLGLSLIAISILILGTTGCGGGGDSDTPNTSTKSLSGNVADGYLVGATVCLDKNFNSQCDSGEPTTKTTTNGKFTLSGLSNDDISTYPIFVEVDEFVIDEDDNKTVAQYYTLTAVPGYSFISPISTMIRNYQVVHDVSHMAARAVIRRLLDITEVSLTVADYIASDLPEAKAVHKKAKIIANLKMNIYTSLRTTVNTTEAKVMDRYINDKIMEKLSDIKTEVDSNSVDLNTSIQNIMGTISLSSATSELIAIKNDFDAKELEANLGTTLNVIISSMDIEQNTKYTRKYNGATDFLNFTIKNSVNKLCTLYILDTTNSFNQYGQSYIIDGSDYTKSSYNLGRETENNNFSIGWMYYSETYSHVDFYVNCEI